MTELHAHTRCRCVRASLVASRDNLHDKGWQRGGLIRVRQRNLQSASRASIVERCVKLALGRPRACRGIRLAAGHRGHLAVGPCSIVSVSDGDR